MYRSVAITGSALVGFGGAVFLWKSVGLGLPIAPSDTEGLWRVELELQARGSGRRGSVRVPLPSTGPGQVVFDERSASDRLRFTIRTEDDQRIGVWSGRFTGVHQLVHGFRVQLTDAEAALPADVSPAPPREVAERHGRGTSEFPSDADEIRAALERIRLPDSPDPLVRIRALFGFVSDEIATEDTATDDAVLTLAGREGSARGKTRLLVTLLRAAGVPARTALGLQLRDGEDPVPKRWVEAWLGGAWMPLDPVGGRFAARPESTVLLGTGPGAEIASTGVEAVGHDYHGLRERLRPEELSAMMVPPNRLLARLSLYRLPVPTQAALRLLLLLPLGALLVAIFRNLVGVPTFGTFMPILIAVALRETSLGRGLVMVGAVIALGIAGRLVLERLRLLLVPRLAILLCLVVLTVTAMALVGGGLGERDLTSGVLFPMVILTMLIERFSVVSAEEGLQQALTRAAFSTGVAVAVYPIFQSPVAEHLVFGFPELVFAIIGALVFIGGYTGYRISDLIRFRAFAERETHGA